MDKMNFKLSLLFIIVLSVCSAELKSQKEFFLYSLSVANNECYKKFGEKPFVQSTSYLRNFESKFLFESYAYFNEDSIYWTTIDFDSTYQHANAYCKKMSARHDGPLQKGKYKSNGRIRKWEKKHWINFIPDDYVFFLYFVAGASSHRDFITITDSLAILRKFRGDWIYEFKSKYQLSKLITEINKRLNLFKAGGYYTFICDGSFREIYSKDEKYICSNCCLSFKNECNQFDDIFKFTYAIFDTNSTLTITARE